MSVAQTQAEVGKTEQVGPTLVVGTDKVCFILTKARQFHGKVGITDPESGSNATDDGMVDILEDDADDPVELELVTFIHDLNVDEKIELVALAWLGRGDGTLDEWPSLCSAAKDAQNTRTAAYLMGMPLLSNYLEEGLSLFGETCVDYSRVEKREG